jgi:hypothetical protein
MGTASIGAATRARWIRSDLARSCVAGRDEASFAAVVAIVACTVALAEGESRGCSMLVPTVPVWS